MTNKLNNFIILQYKESSLELHWMVVPNIPKIPDPIIPPFDPELIRDEPFAMLYIICGFTFLFIKLKM